MTNELIKFENLVPEDVFVVKNNNKKGQKRPKIRSPSDFRFMASYFKKRTKYMKCDSCINKCLYSTGSDEYPPLTILSACKKHHWCNGDPGPRCNEHVGLKDPWFDCKDYERIVFSD